MSKQDLILITPDFLPSRGGVARYLGLFAEYFHERILVVAPLQKNGEENTFSYLIERTPLLFARIWPHWLKTVNILIRKSANCRFVITSHVIPFGTAAMVAKFFTKKPYIVVVHGMDVRLAAKKNRSLTARVLSNAYLVVANSNALAQELQQNFGLTNILTIYPPVDQKFLQENPVSHVPSSMFRLLSVSRLVERKGHERVLQALAMLKLNGSLSSFLYTIVGEGEMRLALEALVIELDLQSHVVFTGDVSDEDLKQCYKNADVFVLPVKNDPIDKEGFGMVYIEAAAFGIPSIATRMNGVDEAVLDHQTGLLVEDGDIEELARAIFLLAMDSSLRISLGQTGRERVFSTFTSAVQFSKLEPYLV